MGRPERYLSILEQLNMRAFSILSIFLTLSWVATPNFSFAQDDPWLGLVPEVVHTEGGLAGMTTYRLYLYTPNETDFLVSCSGDDDDVAAHGLAPALLLEVDARHVELEAVRLDGCHRSHERVGPL